MPYVELMSFDPQETEVGIFLHLSPLGQTVLRCNPYMASWKSAHQLKQSVSLDTKSVIHAPLARHPSLPHFLRPSLQFPGIAHPNVIGPRELSHRLYFLGVSGAKIDICRFAFYKGRSDFCVGGDYSETSVEVGRDT